MKRVLSGTLLVGLAVAGAGPALAQPPYPPIPPPRFEQVPPPPGRRLIWEPGHWQWNGVQYAWVEGRYVPRRPHYGRYVPGHWQWAPREGRYVWRPAHWA